VDWRRGSAGYCSSASCKLNTCSHLRSQSAGGARSSAKLPGLRAASRGLSQLAGDAVALGGTSASLAS
jgi:hypothetical protein